MVSGIIALLSLVFMFIGMSKISSAKEELAKAGGYLNDISSIVQGVSIPTPDGKRIRLIPTEGVIEQLKEIANSYKSESFKILQKVLYDNIGYDQKTGKHRRELLLDGVFPKVVSQDRPFKFRDAYRSALRGLIRIISGGDIPTDEEIANEEELVRQDFGFLVDQESAHQIRGGKKGVQTQKKVGGYTEEEIREIAIRKAVLNKARSIKVYCADDVLDVVEEAYSLTSGQPPAVEDMWWAQLSYWIQRDIFLAIAKTNEQAKDVTASVVKRIVDVQMMHGYVTAEGFVGKDQPNLPPSFTEVYSNKYFDVLQFSITLIVDQTRLPQLIENVYKEGHYTLYLCNIDAVNLLSEEQQLQEQNESLYYYGTQPLVKVTMYWETYLIRDFYHWGIVGYDVDNKTGKAILIFYDGSKVEVDDIEDRKPLDKMGKGLMPKSIREALVGG